MGCAILSEEADAVDWIFCELYVQEHLCNVIDDPAVASESNTIPVLGIKRQ
jgi:hypothetical protein